ncbi:MAG: signal recognition particle protein [candidate division WOR-3 bacterium]
MFEVLSDRFTKLQRRLLGYGRLSSKEITDALREVRTVLLEADVNYRVVGAFIRSVETALRERNIERVLKPGEVINYTLHTELTRLLGSRPTRLDLSASPSVICLVGLQGTGKTTLAGKLARRFASHRPLLVACDPKRPAAAEQLRLVSEQAGCDFLPVNNDVIATCLAGLDQAKSRGNNLVIFDTAGRLHIDDELMTELSAIQDRARPHVTLLVLDGMTGQDAVNQAEAFHQRLRLTGCCITKLDGDTRGGAVVSVRHTTGLPVLFIGTGEKLTDLEEFHPDRIASRILGLGDIKTLVEKMQTTSSPPDQAKTAEKFLKGKFDLDDFLNQLRNMRKMGSMSKLIAMIPGAGSLNVDESELVKVEAMIQSMTPAERQNPDIIDGSRRRRIAEGSGTTVAEVNRLLKEFEASRLLARRLSSGRMPGLRHRR